MLLIQTLVSVAKHPLFGAVIQAIVQAAKNGIDISNEHFVHAHTGPGERRRGWQGKC